MNVLIVDDDDTLRGLLARELARSGHAVSEASSGRDGLARVVESEPEVVLLDLQLPDVAGVEVLRQIKAERPAVEVVVLTAHGTVDTAIAAMKLGAFDFLQKPCHLDELDLTLQRAHERRRLAEENARLKDGLVPSAETEMVGSGPAFEQLRRFIDKVAATDSTVLVRGETGTGKEMVARAVHERSPRKNQPFVVVDCASLQESLLQSELFGHEKGAFTGASRLKHGLFETANGGTAFLDEIGDVSPAVQASLLRVLETSTFRRVGGTKEVRVDVRLIAATNRNLERMMSQGQFRKDLYFRLTTFNVEILPLRQRRADIPVLVEQFVGHHNMRYGTSKIVTPDTMRVLEDHHFPGNVRELRHIVERALVFADGDLVMPTDLPPDVGCCSLEPAAPHAQEAPHAPSLLELEAQHIARVLEEVRGHRAKAASILGISERNLYRKIRQYRLERLAPDAGD